MGANIRQLIRLWGIHAKLDLLWFTRDTKYCLYNIIADVISSLSSVAAVFLLAKRFGSIGGMQERQVLFMLGYACLVDGTIQCSFP
jgi:ABC-2 type transport system permease protein